MDQKYMACILEIYQDAQRYNQYFCKVELGNIGFSTHSVGFIKGDLTFEVGLNGPGRNKAMKKVRGELQRRSLENILHWFEKKDDGIFDFYK